MNTTEYHDVLPRVTAALAACKGDREAAYAMPHRGDLENVARCARLALISARIAAWWAVLARETYRQGGPHALLFGQAVIVAEHAERDHARFWRDSAADWQARAERRPTSDAAGSLSNWAELGVSA